MANPRTNDAGALIKPVEITDGNGITVTCVAPSADNFGTFAKSLPVVGQEFVFVGSGWDRLRDANVFKTVNLAAATAETALWTPAAGKKFRLVGLVLTVGGAADCQFNDGAGGSTVFLLSATAAQVFVLERLGNGLVSGAANRALTVVRSTAVTLKGTLWGTEE
jgi:hypothetical protein